MKKQIVDQLEIKNDPTLIFLRQIRFMLRKLMFFKSRMDIANETIILNEINKMVIVAQKEFNVSVTIDGYSINHTYDKDYMSHV